MDARAWPKLIAASAVIGVLCGMSSGAFLIALDHATAWRETHRWIIALLPLAGFVIGVAYWRWGREVEPGTSLVIDGANGGATPTIHWRLTPMIFLATVATHLFGGSAGREGVAVQMGGGLADRVVKSFGLDGAGRRLCLMAGISGGFAAIFGTPWAGAIFAMEVLAIGALRWQGAVVCVVSALIGDQVCRLLPVVHTHYDAGALPAFGPVTALWTVAVGCAAGLMARIFCLATDGVGCLAKRAIAWSPARLAVGGALVAVVVWLAGTTRHIGLGIPLIQESFTAIQPWHDCALKLALTAITIGVGFKGGEVTPLFCVGATMGSALAVVVPLPVGLLAALGFTAMFAGAANTPLACTVMAMELFGPGIGLWAALACAFAWLCSSQRGIYHAQRVAVAKPLRKR